MRILLAGWVPAERRWGVMRMARALRNAFPAVCESSDQLKVDAALPSPEAVPALGRVRVRFEKRVLAPLRWRCTPWDVLHIADNDYLLGLTARQLARTVVTCHDLMPLVLHKDPRQSFGSVLGFQCYQRTLRNLGRVGHVVCPSAFTRRLLLERGYCSPERVTIITQGVEDRFRPLPKEEPVVAEFRRRHALDDKKVVLHVGSCVAYKNVETVLRVFSQVKERLGEPCVLLKVGGSFTAAQSALREALGLDADIRHLPNVSEDALVAAYNAADVLLWPSLMEGFGMPVLEAMACGVPVVCSDAGPLPELVGGAAMLCSARDEEALFAAVHDVLRNDARANEMRERGLARARAYSWARAAAGYYERYRDVRGQMELTTQ